MADPKLRRFTVTKKVTISAETLDDALTAAGDLESHRHQVVSEEVYVKEVANS